MIRREAGNDWLLIPQFEHARLAADLAEKWGNETVASLPVADWLIPAIRDHDAGWRTWWQSPRLDAEMGRPVNFTEMPLAVSTAIWTESICVCARGSFAHGEALNRYQQYLTDSDRLFTQPRAAVLDAVLQFRSAFFAFELASRIARTGLEIEEANIQDILGELDEAEVIQQRETSIGTPVWEATVSPFGRSPFGGIWVSRHFSSLAENARPYRTDPADQQAIETFLAEQKQFRAEWNEEALREFAGEEHDRLIETGFRFVQFFDRLSLWLCCHPVSESNTFPIRGGPSVAFIPRGENEIAADPYPFSENRLPISVPAFRIPARSYPSDEELHTAIQDAPVEELRWVFLR